MSVNPNPAAVPAPIDDPRQAELLAWLAGHADALGIVPATLRPASSDASFRRYFRVDALRVAGGTLIAMDAPPAREDSRPFVAVARLFAQAGLRTPAVLAADLEQGFVLLDDLGPSTYADALAVVPRDEARIESLYRDALGALVQLQSASRPGELPPYDLDRLLAEMRLFPEWYVGRHLGVALPAALARGLEQSFAQLAAAALAQPAVYVHRDYHCRNLMVVPGGPGVLDFQDAVFGPITYDLVSLLRDAYVDWPEERQIDWAVRYWERARGAGLPVAADFGDFWRDLEWMGLQRHLKVLGIFARLWHRDGKDRYLAELPRVMGHAIRAASRYDALAPLLRVFEHLQATAGPGGAAAVAFTF